MAQIDITTFAYCPFCGTTVKSEDTEPPWTTGYPVICCPAFKTLIDTVINPIPERAQRKRKEKRWNM
jgi:hypothetical protein